MSLTATRPNGQKWSRTRPVRVIRTTPERARGGVLIVGTPDLDAAQNLADAAVLGWFDSHRPAVHTTDGWWRVDGDKAIADAIAGEPGHEFVTSEV